MDNDPYAALGLTKSATAGEIKKAYRQIAKTSHPDLNPDDPNAEARFKAAASAFELLKDPEKRARFDRGEIDASGSERPERKYYRDYADAQQGAYRPGPGFGGGDDFGDTSDIFAEFLRQRGQGRSGTSSHGFSMRGADHRYALEVPFLDAVNGGKTRITLPDGAALEVTIPKGTADGQTIRLRGKGNPGSGGGAAGDALITITVRPHPVFRRDGDDIVMTLPITLDEAVLGGKVEAPTIEGNVGLSIPKGASSGQVLRLRGRGVPSAKGKTRGDQRVELRIVMPSKIDADLTEFMEKWSKSNRYDPRKGIKT